MNHNEAVLRDASYPKLALNLCVPTVIIMVVMVAYNMADVFFIGRLNDPYMIAAVSLCGPLFSILSGLGTLFGSGGCTAISLSIGRKDYESAKHVSSLCFYGSLVIGLLFGTSVLLFLAPVCRMIGSEETTLVYTTEYLRIVALFSPVIIFSNVFMNLVRADGAAKQSMIANLLGTAVNFIFDPIFILVLHWGVMGAAVATVMGNTVSAIYLVWYSLRNKDLFSLHLRDVRLKRETILPVLTLGLPLAFSTILMSISHIIANNLMVRYGSIAVAAQGVAGRISMIISMVAIGICMGMQPAISYNYAANNRERTRSIIRNTGITTVVIGSLLSLGCFLFRDAILTAFIDSEEVRSIGRIMLTASAMVGPVYGLYQLCTTYLQATGKAGYATMASLLNKGLIYLPVLFLLEAAFGMYGIIFTAAVTDLLSIIAAWLLCRLAIRQEQKPLWGRSTPFHKLG